MNPGPAVQGLEDQLVGRRVRVRHELYPGGGRLRAARRRRGPQTGAEDRL